MASRIPGCILRDVADGQTTLIHGRIGESILREGCVVTQLGVRRASVADGEMVTSITTLAFASDPRWSRALARADGSTEHHRRFWKLLIEGALRYSWVC